MKKRKYSSLCRLDTKIKIKLGLDTKADIQDKIIEEYNKFLELKNQIVNYAKEKIELKSDLEVKYKWIDIDNNQLENKEKLLILKNQMEILKRSSRESKEMTNASISYRSAFEQAIINYINNGNDEIINILVNKMKNQILENKYNSFNFVTNYEEYEDIIKIVEKIETLKVQLKYSEDWENAHRNKKIIERKIK